MTDHLTLKLPHQPKQPNLWKTRKLHPPQLSARTTSKIVPLANSQIPQHLLVLIQIPQKYQKTTVNATSVTLQASIQRNTPIQRTRLLKLKRKRSNSINTPNITTTTAPSLLYLIWHRLSNGIAEVTLLTMKTCSP